MIIHDKYNVCRRDVPDAAGGGARVHADAAAILFPGAICSRGHTYGFVQQDLAA